LNFLKLKFNFTTIIKYEYLMVDIAITVVTIYK
jgi:hypothetical protein